MEEKHIILMEEEVNSLDNFKEICIYEDNERKIFIKLPESKEQILKQNILDRYNNEEYWDLENEEEEDTEDTEDTELTKEQEDYILEENIEKHYEEKK